MLKLAEEEAIALVGSVDAAPELGVRETVVTRGARGCPSSPPNDVEHVPQRRRRRRRSNGRGRRVLRHVYVGSLTRSHTRAAAWRATALVAGLLARTAR